MQEQLPTRTMAEQYGSTSTRTSPAFLRVQLELQTVALALTAAAYSSTHTQLTLNSHSTHTHNSPLTASAPRRLPQPRHHPRERLELLLRIHTEKEALRVAVLDEHPLRNHHRHRKCIEQGMRATLTPRQQP